MKSAIVMCVTWVLTAALEGTRAATTGATTAVCAFGLSLLAAGAWAATAAIEWTKRWA